MEEGQAAAQSISQASLSSVNTSPVRDNANPDPTDTTTNTKKRGRQKSIVWGHMSEKYEVVVDGVKKIFAKCNYCKEELSADTVKNGTNGLRKHLYFACKGGSPLLENKVKGGLTQTTLSNDTIGGSMTYHNFNQKRCDLKVVRYVIKDEIPFRAVEKSGFKELLYELQPRFKQPNRKKVAAGVWELFLSEKEKIKSVIKDKRVSITTDTWTSIQNINYMVVTAHFLDDEWKIHKRIINFSPISSHKGEEIGKLLEKLLSGWEIDRVFSITVDNATANDVAIGYMNKVLNESSTLMFGGKYLHMRCACHIINLVVRDGIEELQSSIEAIRNCAKYIHSSPQRLGKFREVCSLLKRKENMPNVPLDVPTRWNSTYKLLDSALKYRSVFDRLANDYVPFCRYFEDKKGPPSAEDWENAVCFAHFLSTFHAATLKFSATKRPTAHLLFTGLAGIQCEIQKAMKKVGDLVLQTVACSMKVKFDKYWGSFEKVNILMYVAIALDPRMKLKMIGICYRLLETKQTVIDHICELVKKNLNELFNEYSKGSTTTSDGVPNVGDEDSIDISSDDLMMQTFMEELAKEKKVGSVETSNEVDKYLNDPLDSFSKGEFDILLWWKDHASKYPTLALIARDVLAIPTSTIASENAFSLSDRIVDPFRASLTPKMVEALVCSSDWLRAEDFSFYKEPTDNELELYRDLEELEASGCGPSSTPDDEAPSGTGIPPLAPRHS